MEVELDLIGSAFASGEVHEKGHALTLNPVVAVKLAADAPAPVLVEDWNKNWLQLLAPLSLPSYGRSELRKDSCAALEVSLVLQQHSLHCCVWL